jgi:hypothetical protein
MRDTEPNEVREKQDTSGGINLPKRYNGRKDREDECPENGQGSSVLPLTEKDGCPRDVEDKLKRVEQ